MKINGKRSIVGVLAASFAIVGCPFIFGSASAEPLDVDTPGLMTVNEAKTALDSLSVGEDSTSYNRADFSTGWKVVTAEKTSWYGWNDYVTPGSKSAQQDVTDALEPQKGCDAREITLIRDAVDGTVKWDDDCSVISGEWYDSYTGKTITNPQNLDIEHIVALNDAWKTGADKWTSQEREFFAHDPLVLAAVDKSENREKGSSVPKIEFNEDGTPKLDTNGNVVIADGGWIPDNKDEWKGYAQRYISIKSNYGLSINDEGVRQTLAFMLGEAPQPTAPADSENKEDSSNAEVKTQSVTNDDSKNSDESKSAETKSDTKSNDTKTSDNAKVSEVKKPVEKTSESSESKTSETKTFKKTIASTGNGYKDAPGAEDIEPNLLDKAYVAIAPLAGNAGEITGWSQSFEGSTLVISAHYQKASFYYNTANGTVKTFNYGGNNNSSPEKKAPAKPSAPKSENRQNSAPKAQSPKSNESSSNQNRSKVQPEGKTITKTERHYVKGSDSNRNGSQSGNSNPYSSETSPNRVNSNMSSNVNSPSEFHTGGEAQNTGRTGILVSILGFLGLASLVASRKNSKVKMN